MSPTLIFVIVVAAGVVAVVAWAVARARASRDGVDSFRRQIDALSPEARRTVVGQVQNAAERRDRRDGHSADDAGADDAGGDDAGADEPVSDTADPDELGDDTGHDTVDGTHGDTGDPDADPDADPDGDLGDGDRRGA